MKATAQQQPQSNRNAPQSKSIDQTKSLKSSMVVEAFSTPMDKFRSCKGEQEVGFIPDESDQAEAAVVLQQEEEDGLNDTKYLLNYELVQNTITLDVQPNGDKEENDAQSPYMEKP